MKRDRTERDASRATLADEIANLRSLRSEVRAELQRLPLAASRTPAQKRDALTLRVQLATIRTVLALAGVDTAADRSVGADRS